MILFDSRVSIHCNPIRRFTLPEPFAAKPLVFFYILFFALITQTAFAIDEVVIDDFEDGVFSWSTVGMSDLTESDGVITGITDVEDARLWTDHADFDGSRYNVIVLRMYNDKTSATRSFEIFWENQDGTFHADRRVHGFFENDGSWNTYFIDLSENVNWTTHPVEKLRIDPQNFSEENRFAIDYVRVVSREKVWPMDLHGEIYNVANLDVDFQLGKLYGTTEINLADPYFKLFESNVHTDHYNTIEYLAEYSVGAGKRQQLVFHTTASGPVSLTYQNETQEANQEGFYSYYLGGEQEWTGQINWMRLDLVPGESTPYDVVIDWVNLAYRLPPPLLLAPENDHSTNYGNTPLFTWAPTGDPRGDLEVDQYQIQIAQNQSFTLIEQEATIQREGHADTLATFYHASGLANGTYYWRIRAIDREGNPSAYSEKRKYTITDTAGGPDAPLLVAPEDYSNTIQKHPFFDWTEVADGAGSYSPPPAYVITVDHYEIQIAEDAAFTSLVDTDKVFTTRYVPLSTLPEKDLWWRVRTVDSEGTAGPWSLTNTFSIQFPPNQLILLIPDGVSLNTVRNNLNAAHNAGIRRVHFASNGYYEFDPTGLDPDEVCLDLLTYENMVIDGRGSTIIIQKPNASFTRANHSANLVIKDFTVDYETLPYTVGTVEYVDYVNFKFDLRIHAADGYKSPLDDMFGVSQPGTVKTWGCLMDPIVPGRLKVNTHSHYSTDDANIIDLGGDLYRMPLAGSHASPHYIDTFEAGDIYVRMARTRAVNTALFSENITYEDLTIYAGPAQGFMPGHGDNISILNCTVGLKEGRYLSVDGDGAMVVSYRTGPWIEGCTFEGLMDDGVNVSSMYLNIDFVYEEGPNPLVFVYGAPEFGALEVDDQLLVYDPPTCEEQATLKVLSIDGFEYGGKIYRYVEVDVLSGSLANVTPGQDPKESTVIYNLNRRGDSFSVRDTIYRNQRRYGGLIKGLNGVIERNRYEGLHSRVLSISNQSTVANGYDASNLLVQGNEISGCGYEAFGTFPPTVFQITMMNSYFELSPYPRQTDIRILRNQIADWQYRAVNVGCGVNTLVKGNLMNASYWIYPRYGGDGFLSLENYALSVENSSDVKVHSNVFMDQRYMQDIYLIDNELSVEKLGNKYPDDFVR